MATLTNTKPFGVLKLASNGTPARWGQFSQRCAVPGAHHRMQKARARSKQDIALTALDEGLELLRLILGQPLPVHPLAHSTCSHACTSERSCDRRPAVTAGGRHTQADLTAKMQEIKRCVCVCVCVFVCVCVRVHAQMHIHSFTAHASLFDSQDARNQGVCVRVCVCLCAPQMHTHSFVHMHIRTRRWNLLAQRVHDRVDSLGAFHLRHAAGPRREIRRLWVCNGCQRSAAPRDKHACERRPIAAGGAAQRGNAVLTTSHPAVLTTSHPLARHHARGTRARPRHASTHRPRRRPRATAPSWGRARGPRPPQGPRSWAGPAASLGAARSASAPAVPPNSCSEGPALRNLPRP